MPALTELFYATLWYTPQGPEESHRDLQYPRSYDLLHTSPARTTALRPGRWRRSGMRKTPHSAVVEQGSNSDNSHWSRVQIRCSTQSKSSGGLSDRSVSACRLARARTRPRSRPSRLSYYRQHVPCSHFDTYPDTMGKTPRRQSDRYRTLAPPRHRP